MPELESEKVVESYLCKEIRKLGGEAYKVNSPQRRGVLDRWCVLPLGLIYFVECKSEGEVPEAHQEREIIRLKRKGHKATYVDTKAAVDNLIKEIKLLMWGLQ